MASVSSCRFVRNIGWSGIVVPPAKNLTVWGDPAMLVMKTAMPRQTLLLELHHWASPKCCNWVFLISFSPVCHLEGCILGELLGGSAHFHGGLYCESVGENHRDHEHLDSGRPRCQPLPIPLLLLPVCTLEGPHVDVSNSCQPIH